LVTNWFRRWSRKSIPALTRRFIRTGQHVMDFPVFLIWSGFYYIAQRRNAPPHKRRIVKARQARVNVEV